MTEVDMRHPTRWHDWHTFDELLGYEVRRLGSTVELRHRDQPTRVLALDLRQFNALRGAGPKPRGLS